MAVDKVSLKSDEARTRRKNNGYTIMQVVQKIMEQEGKSVSDKTIRLIEQGKEVKRDTARMYATAVGAALDELEERKTVADRLSIDLTDKILFGKFGTESIGSPDGEAIEVWVGPLKDEVTSLVPATYNDLYKCVVQWKNSQPQANINISTGHQRVLYVNEPMVELSLIWYADDALSITESCAECINELNMALADLKNSTEFSHSEFSLSNMISRGKRLDVIIPHIKALETQHGLHFLHGELHSFDFWTEQYVNRPMLYLCKKQISAVNVSYRSYDLF